MRFHRYVRYFFVFLSICLFLFSCDSGGGKVGYLEYENHIALEGEDNMRDLGGYFGESGRRVLYRKLFRSGELFELTPADLEELATLDLFNVIDLRTDEEFDDEPDQLPEGPVLHHLPLLENLDYGDIKREELSSKIFAGELDAEEYMIAIYSTIDELRIQSWTAIFDLLETGDTTLWHCTEGKDRAGMTTALVLLSLGVDETDVIEDFMLSNEYLSESIESTVALIDQHRGEGMGELLRPLLSVKEEYIIAFFDAIEDQYGSIDAFLAELDVDIDAMRINFLE